MNKFVRLLAIGAVGLSSLIALQTSFAAAATPSHWIYVGAGAIDPSGKGTNCNYVATHTITGAISLAEAYGPSTIRVCPGTYREQVKITGPYTLAFQAVLPGRPTIIESPSAPTTSSGNCDATGSYDLVEVCPSNPVIVSMTSITLKAAWPSGDCSSSPKTVVVGRGATFAVSMVTFAAAAAPAGGCNSAVSLAAGSTTPASHGIIRLNNATMSGYTSRAVAITGAGTKAYLIALHVVGAGPVPVVRTGVSASDGALLKLVNSTVFSNECSSVTCGSDITTHSQSVGVSLIGAATGSVVDSSTVKGNDVGVLYQSTSASLPSSPDANIQNNAWVGGNRYENVVVYQGLLGIKYAHLNGSRIGLEAIQTHVQPYGPHVLGTRDRLNGASYATIRVFSDRTVGDPPGSLTFTATLVLGPVRNNSLNVSINL